MSEQKKVAVIMGSDSDFPTVAGAIRTLKAYDVPFEVHIMSAHRTPEAAAQFSADARKNGFGVIIAAAGKAAHLAGVLAAHTSCNDSSMTCHSTSSSDYTFSNMHTSNIIR